jgi:hypothetical protein
MVIVSAQGWFSAVPPIQKGEKFEARSMRRLIA